MHFIKKTDLKMLSFLDFFKHNYFKIPVNNRDFAVEFVTNH